MDMSEKDKVADAISDSWVYRAIPLQFWPYAQLARWERPIGWWLLMWPCWWSVALGTTALLIENPALLMDQRFLLTIPLFLLLFTLGAVAMRGAGCTYNDLVDQDIDDKVARTRSRPLPSGRVTQKGTIIFLVLQALSGLVVLLQFNLTAIGFGLLSVITLLVYPFMKRITWWPQLFLGFAFSWGAWMGWIAITDTVGMTPILLYLGCILWVIGYDTIYAHQDIEDDALVGVKSTARLFGANTKPALSILYSGAVIFWASALWSANNLTDTMSVTLSVQFVTLLIVAVHMAWQVITLKLGDPAGCLRLFKSNSTLGWIMFVGLIIGAMLT